MINRILLRIKVIQILFSYYKSNSKDVNDAKNELTISLDKTYELYMLLLRLAVEVSDYAKTRKESIAKRCQMAGNANFDSGEKIPADFLAENKVAQQLAENETLNKFLEEHKLSWNKHPEIINSLYAEALTSQAYETAEAIDCESDEMLVEELGDVMLQVMFHSRIAEEEGRFTVDDVYTGVCKKMIERHPHIFGDVSVSSVDDVLTNWESIKQNSKNRETLEEQLDGVCKALPALMLASKYIGKCMKNGMKIESGIQLDNVTEETVGDILFDVVALARSNKIDPELALQRRCERFLESVKQDQ